MSSVEAFLLEGEHIGESFANTSDITSVDYTAHVIQRPGLKSGDEVLLEIRGFGEPCILMGGNSIELEVVSGFGKLAMIDLTVANITDIPLAPGTKAVVPPKNTLYWYENGTDDPLIVRDRCDDFDSSNEPTLEKVVNALHGGPPIAQVSCGNCVSACCRGKTEMELTRREVRFMKEGGNKLTKLHDPVDSTGKVRVQVDTGRRIMQNGVLCKVVVEQSMILTKGHGLYRLENDCTYLETDKNSAACTVYDKRPGICRDFKVGEQGCLRGREVIHASNRFPEWQPVELTTR